MPRFYYIIECPSCHTSQKVPITSVDYICRSCGDWWEIESIEGSEIIEEMEG